MNPGPSNDAPPPLPPRPNDQVGGPMMAGASHTMNPMYNNPYQSSYGVSSFNNSYGQGMYGGGMYGGGMMGNYGYGGGGYGGVPDGNFARLAEESSRGAFQSIESVVNAVTSVANMLSSTHNAVYSSFRAVIGVVEQFGRLRMQITSVVVSLSIFKFLVRLFKTLLVYLRLKPANYASSHEFAWGEAKEQFGSDVLGGGGAPSVSWPSLLFWAVAIGGPWLIYKCIDQMVRAVEEKRKWATGTSPHYTAQGLFDFQASSDQELSFMKGETLRIAPKDEQPRVRGWILASTQDGSRIGLVPINYVNVTGRKSESPPTTSDSFAMLNNAFKK